jgi:pimeloyl-ACP methyl ester carboxylesterase
VSLRRGTFRVDAGVMLAGEGALEVAVEVIAPAKPKPIALVCLAGGGMNRRYWDLQAPGDDSYSFARQMAARGLIVVLIDHLGVGESSKPADSYALTAEVLARANTIATKQVLAKLGNGSAINRLGPIPKVTSVGVGHSMGAMLTVMQQAEARQHRAIALLGFSTRGLPEYLMGEARELASDIAAARREAVRLARAMFRENYPYIGRSEQGATLYAGKAAEPAGVEAIKAAREPLLPVPAFASMLPGNVAAEAARITVPVFVGLGERDIAGPPLEAPKAFTASPAVTFHLLPGAGHSHFLFPARRELYQRVADWARAA